MIYLNEISEDGQQIKGKAFFLVNLIFSRLKWYFLGKSLLVHATRGF